MAGAALASQRLPVLLRYPERVKLQTSKPLPQKVFGNVPERAKRTGQGDDRGLPGTPDGECPPLPAEAGGRGRSGAL